MTFRVATVSLPRLRRVVGLAGLLGDQSLGEPRRWTLAVCPHCNSGLADLEREEGPSGCSHPHGRLLPGWCGPG